MKANFVLSSCDDFVFALLTEYYKDSVDSISRDIKNGYAFVYKVVVEDAVKGIIINRVDTNHQMEREFVVLHTVKSDKSFDGKTFFDILDAGELEIAKLYDCQYIRRHIDRPGMAPFLESYGYEAVEIVYKRRVDKCPLSPAQNHLTRAVQRIKTTE